MEQRSLLCFLWLVLLFDLTLTVAGNAEGDVLTMLKNSLSFSDSANNIFQSWNNTLVTPCTWLNVTCNAENQVVRVDLSNANLSGKLVPELGQLSNLQYLELFSNNITGEIPEELGDLTELVSLTLFLNNISGPIPSSLGKLKKLRILRLNNNSLSGEIPMSLTAVLTLVVLDLSNNQLSGDIPVNGSFVNFTPVSFNNNKGLTPLPLSSPTSTSSMPPPPSGSQPTAAIARGVAAGAALLSALAWWF